MIDIKPLKIGATDLTNLDGQNIVKVAGVVRRLYNWFKQLGSEEYKQQVLDLRNESSTVRAYMDDLAKQIDRLQAAIKDADVQDYEQALEEVKYLSAQLSKELDRLHNTAENTELPVEPNNKPVSSKEQMTSEIKQLSTESVQQDRLRGSINKPLRTISHLSSLPIYISEVFKNRTEEFFKNLNQEIGAFLENSNNKSVFFDQLSNAIKNGIVTKVYPIKKENRELQNYVTITMAPFSVPNLNYKITGTVLLNEVPDKKLSIMRLLSANADPIKTSSVAARKKVLHKIAVGKEVPRQYTNVGPVKFAQVMMEAYKNIFGQYPTAQTLGMIWAQAAVESGQNFRLMNNNVGNITTSANSSWVKSGNPYVKVNVQEFDKGGKPFKVDMLFKAFSTPLDGAIYYLNFLKRNYPQSLAAPGESSWKGAGKAFDDAIYLASKNYYTANIPSYAKGMDSLFDKFMTQIYPQLNPKPLSAPTPPPSESLPYRKVRKEVGPDNPELPRPEEKSAKWSWQGTQQNQEFKLDIGEQYAMNDTEVDSLMDYFYSSASGPLDAIVKESIIKKTLPITSVVVSLSSSNFPTLAKYAVAFSEVFDKIIGGTCEVHSDKKSIEVVCSTVGNKKTVINAILAICDSINDGMYLKYNKIVKSQIIDKNNSSFDLINNLLLKTSERKFHLNIVK